MTIQVNAFGQGLGATRIQDDGPVAFTSKVLTPTEQCYTNNERNYLLASSIFGAERFRTYVFGRHFTIESDHKSLEQISMKNLADAPVCLQRMLLIWQMPQYVYRGCYSDVRIMISQSSITQEKKRL